MPRGIGGTIRHNVWRRGHGHKGHAIELPDPTHLSSNALIVIGVGVFIVYILLLLPFILSDSVDVFSIGAIIVLFFGGLIFNFWLSAYARSCSVCILLGAFLIFAGGVVLIMGPISSCKKLLQNPLLRDVSVCDSQSWRDAGLVYFNDGAMLPSFPVEIERCRSRNKQLPGPCTFYIAPVTSAKGSRAVCGWAMSDSSPPAVPDCGEGGSGGFCGRKVDFKSYTDTACSTKYGSRDGGRTLCEMADASINNAIEAYARNRSMAYNVNTPLLELANPAELQSECTPWIVLGIILAALYVPPAAVFTCLKGLSLRVVEHAEHHPSQAGAEIGNPTRGLSGMRDASASNVCKACGGHGEQGLFGPKGFGFFNSPCPACGGTGFNPVVSTGQSKPEAMVAGKTVSSAQMGPVGSMGSASGLSEDQEHKLRLIFELIDGNRDNYITIHEFIKAVRTSQAVADVFKIPHEIHQEDGSLWRLEKVFHKWDSDGDGKITWEELRGFYAEHMNEKKAKRLDNYV